MTRYLLALALTLFALALTLFTLYHGVRAVDRALHPEAWATYTAAGATHQF